MEAAPGTGSMRWLGNGQAVIEDSGSWGRPMAKWNEAFGEASRPQLEAIRGGDCNGVTNTLLQRGLIQEAGRLDSVGHPILYSTTLAFLQHFGLETPDQLPPIDES